MSLHQTNPAYEAAGRLYAARMARGAAETAFAEAVAEAYKVGVSVEQIAEIAQLSKQRIYQIIPVELRGPRGRRVAGSLPDPATSRDGARTGETRQTAGALPEPLLVGKDGAQSTKDFAPSAASSPAAQSQAG